MVERLTESEVHELQATGCIDTEFAKLHKQIDELNQRLDNLKAAVKTTLYGTVLDEYDNRDADGMLFMVTCRDWYTIERLANHANLLDAALDESNKPLS